MLMVGTTKQHDVDNAFGVDCNAPCEMSADHMKCKGPSSTRSATCDHKTPGATNECQSPSEHLTLSQTVSRHGYVHTCVNYMLHFYKYHLPLRYDLHTKFITHWFIS